MKKKKDRNEKYIQYDICASSIKYRKTPPLCFIYSEPDTTVECPFPAPSSAGMDRKLTDPCTSKSTFLVWYNMDDSMQPELKMETVYHPCLCAILYTKAQQETRFQTLG